MKAGILSLFFVTMASSFGQTIKWDLVSPYPTAMSLNAVTFGAGKFVAVGNAVALCSEDNGLTWTEGTGVGPESYVGVAHGNGKFVAVSRGAGVMTSIDGKTWSAITPAGNPGMTGIAFGNNVFLAPGLAGKVGRSTNGADWTFTSVGPGQQGGWIAFGNGEFIINQYLGASGSIFFLSSIDGIEWSAYQPNIPRPIFSFWEQASGLTFGDGGFVTVAQRQGAGRDAMFSADGITFENRGHTPGDVVIGLNGEFAAIAQFFAASWSADLTTWAQWPPSYGDITAGVSGGGEDVLVGRFGAIWRGPNLASLERVDSDKSTRLVGVAANGPTIVGIHSMDPPTFLVSTNGGPKFTPIPAPETSGLLTAIAQANGIFVTVGRGGTVLRSSDGLNWSKRLSDTSSDLNDVANGGGFWVAVGANGKIISSTDASVFSLRSSGTEVALNGVTYGAGKFVAVGVNGVILSSANGTAWAMTGTDEAKDLYAVAYGNGRFVATGLNGIVHSWVDGLARETTTITGASALRVAFQNGRFVALDVGRSHAYTSFDGLGWAPAFTPYGELFAINSSDNRLWLSGYYDPFVAGSLIWKAGASPLAIFGSVAAGKFHAQITVPTPGKYRVYRSATSLGTFEPLDLLNVTGAAADWVDNEPIESAAFYTLKSEP